jgi:hypothetical protein
MRFQQAQRREVEAIAAISDRIAVELEKESLVDALVLQTTQKHELIKSYNTDLAKLVVKGSETQASRHGQLNVSLISPIAFNALSFKGTVLSKQKSLHPAKLRAFRFSTNGKSPSHSFSRDRQAEIRFRQGSSSAEVSNSLLS